MFHSTSSERQREPNQAVRFALPPTYLRTQANIDHQWGIISTPFIYSEEFDNPRPLLNPVAVKRFFDTITVEDVLGEIRQDLIDSAEIFCKPFEDELASKLKPDLAEYLKKIGAYITAFKSDLSNSDLSLAYEQAALVSSTLFSIAYSHGEASFSNFVEATESLKTAISCSDCNYIKARLSWYAGLLYLTYGDILSGQTECRSYVKNKNEALGHYYHAKNHLISAVNFFKDDGFKASKRDLENVLHELVYSAIELIKYEELSEAAEALQVTLGLDDVLCPQIHEDGWDPFLRYQAERNMILGLIRYKQGESDDAYEPLSNAHAFYAQRSASSPIDEEFANKLYGYVFDCI